MRKGVTQAFYLAVFAVFTTSCKSQDHAHASRVSSTDLRPDVCAFEPSARVSDACASYSDLDALNAQLHAHVHNLSTSTDFFSYYRLNLYNKKCPFWSDSDGTCGNIACAVTTVENEADIPAIWRAAELSKLEGPKAAHPGKRQQRERENRPLRGELGDEVGESCVVEYDDECDERDYCVPEDERASAPGDYVSLVDNPERFTGYSGEGARQVWEVIYRENCFSRPKGEQSASVVPSKLATQGRQHQGSGMAMSKNQAQAALDFKQVVRAYDREQARMSGAMEEALEFEDECLEKRVFYRVMSGMHAAISTHLCYDYLNQTTGQWGPNLQCYKDRLHHHPERISNLYFIYALVLRAVGKLRDYVQDYTFCTGEPEQDARTKQMIHTLAAAIPEGPRIFDESVMFQDQTADGIELKEDFRNRFRNVSRIMDCVGCDKCRLWGKIQTNGFGTALKVLFEFGNGHGGEEKPILRRTELVALVNTLDKISSALQAIHDFRGMLASEVLPSSPSDSPSDSDQSKQWQFASSRGIPTESLDDLDDLDDFDFDEDVEQSEMQEETLGEVIYAEFSLVFRTMWYVLRTWAALPRAIGTILTAEVLRLYDIWLGRPVVPRSWTVDFPRDVPRRMEL